MRKRVCVFSVKKTIRSIQWSVCAIYARHWLKFKLECAMQVDFLHFFYVSYLLVVELTSYNMLYTVLMAIDATKRTVDR